MSALQTSKNSPVDGEKEQDLLFLSKVVEFLSKEAREKLANEFYEELKEIRTPQAASQLAKGYKHMSNKTILELAAMSKEARKRILELAKAEAEEVLRAIAALEAEVGE
jgi:flagellar biosynthesis/type III secretory pathway protein FliH